MIASATVGNNNGYMMNSTEEISASVSEDETKKSSPWRKAKKETRKSIAHVRKGIKSAWREIQTITFVFQYTTYV